MAAEPPLRQVVVRNPNGDVIGSGQARMMRPPGDRPTPHKRHMQGEPMRPPFTTEAETDDNDAEAEVRPSSAQGSFGAGPEFLVRMQDGQVLHLHLPRPNPSPWRAPFGFLWTLGLVAVAVALATYPIVRRLTRRLESLQRGVRQWGDGDLSVRVNAQGTDEVADLAQGFNHAAQQIESLVKARDALLASQKSLLANASHELRSPLARIRMGLELMGGASSASREEIARSISELDQLIEEILLASRLDSQQADMGTVEQVELVGLLAEECARSHASLDVEQATLLVPGISKLLRRVVRNLLENANRYASGEVTAIARQTGAVAIVQVCDRGPGVPDALLDRIFEPFYRIPGASEREGGVGLGLALVKSIVIRHQGQVRCFNRPDGGLCIEIQLPMQGAEKA
ncbi:HAMP domain-containing protein [Rhodoferax aquaticus]|uniref:histidine kinase n=2 Tax=Rhodoferax aquaticus TaxID=2527691 RepID=A0A515EW81_9BURK|nr:HAMP domain-containing protein [Rhodoferax aquaticus]